MICAFVALVLLMLEKRHIQYVDIVGGVLLCGGALYYVLQAYRRKRSVTVLMALMAALGLVYNPIYPPHLPTVVWIIIDIVAMALFYLISIRTPVEETIGFHHEEEEK